ncbi:putative peptidase [Cyphellophora attinorum]|uniref:Putative peptidase n=1 Tax=Cyphellophora attinorum TaxID=1664694 RepID=A0A0N1HCK9_9EURO|nr:putative peptidase [Phialophora attinorum]KPI42124.1 putative peptidase [Phialophora attinorum]
MPRDEEMAFLLREIDLDRWRHQGQPSNTPVSSDSVSFHLGRRKSNSSHFLGRPDSGQVSRTTFLQGLRFCVLFGTIIGLRALLHLAWNTAYRFCTASSPSAGVNLAAVQQCTIENLQRDLSFLKGAQPITVSEFIQRQDRLAAVLYQTGIDAFIVEPGYTFQYYSNVSQQDWEPWEPEERPFLMVMQPSIHDDDTVTAKTTYLAAHFEEDRVRQLGIPSRSALDIITWEESSNPYSELLSKAFGNAKGQSVVVDEEMRDFLVRGLSSAGFKTIGLTPDIEAIRQQKTSSEMSILRAVNTGTVEAIRAMRPCLRAGLLEKDVISILNNALLSIPGFSLFFNLVLFDSNAALPHGGKATGALALTPTTVVLIDVGAHYFGYSSDITRSFIIGEPPNTLEELSADLSLKQRVFSTVLAAQTASVAHFRPGQVAANVDLAARATITRLSPAGQNWASRFTHRVGHGIGIKAHESPYLHSGNTKTLLRENMTFTSEPGIYLPRQFGVRTEDVFAVTREKNGEVVCLSGRGARSLWDP